MSPAEPPRPVRVSIAFLLIFPLSLIFATWCLMIVTLIDGLGQGLPLSDDGAWQALADAVVKEPANQLVHGALATASALFVLANLCAPSHDVPFRTRFHIKRVPIAPLLFTIVGAIATSAFAGHVVHLLGVEHGGTLDKFQTVIDGLGFRERLALLPVLALAAAIAEEVFFRGYVFRVLIVTRGPVFALFASAFLFGLVHLDLVQGTAAALMGLFLAYATLCTGSLWPAIAGHALNNALFLLAGFEVEPGASWRIPALLLLALGAAAGLRRHAERSLYGSRPS